MKTKEFLKLVKSNMGPGKNNAEIMAYYVRTTGQTDFRTYRQWLEAGYKVKAGASSYPVFSRPISAIKAEKTGEPTGDERNYFSVAHLFHAGQVEKNLPTV